MEGPRPNFHYPPGLKLTNHKPMVEAWLEIRWKLENGSPQHVPQRDPQFAFALGRFRDKVSDEFTYSKSLETIHLPEEMTPYIVRYQFWKAQGDWPVLQIGPGIATVNFLTYDSWSDFREMARFLRTHLIAAYERDGIETESIALRYRDAESFQYSESDVLEFLHGNLRTSLNLPEYIPGDVGRRKHPAGIDLRLSYDLAFPPGKGSVRLATGTLSSVHGEQLNKAPSEVIVLELEVVSSGDHVPDIHKDDEFDSWLEAAHDVLHEWFFSFIDEGPLWKKYGVES